MDQNPWGRGGYSREEGGIVSKIRLSRFLSDGAKTVIRVTNSKKSAEVVRAPDVFKLLISVLAELGRGNSVTVIPIEAELTTQQAADLLNVSQLYPITLLDERQIPHRKVGIRHRVKLLDVLEYKRRTDEARMRALEELAAQAQELSTVYPEEGIASLDCIDFHFMCSKFHFMCKLTPWTVSGHA